MQTNYHRMITLEALNSFFPPPALEMIIAANIGQDSFRGQIGHDEYHFDANAFTKSRAYIEANRYKVKSALEEGDLNSAYSAFGRLTHAGQDFYAHSNYISLWLERFPADGWPDPQTIDPMDADLLESPALRSGKLYYPLEALSYIPALRQFILPLLPRDSHAWMNLDSPEQGPKFQYAMAAAIKRTRWEFTETLRILPGEAAKKFVEE